jgi:hypothetical protein
MEAIPDMTARDRDGLSRIFRYYAEIETPRMDSPIYTEFSFGVADDPEILDLCRQIDVKQPAPNILYAAVQDMLFVDSNVSPEARALAIFYPVISGEPVPQGSAWNAFRSFCLAHDAELGPNLRTGRTQTCVVHRCTSVLPALASIPRVEAANGRIALLEIGPSLGLNLRLDRYRYEYGRGVAWGEPDARPVLDCETRGDVSPPMPQALEVVARRGLDLNPVDLTDPKTLRWMRALIWPEHSERAQVMNEALVHAESIPLEIEAGDATREIGTHVAKLPTDAPRVLFATHVLYQVSPEGRRELLAGIARASRELPVDFISMESTGEGDSRLHRFCFEGGERTTRVVLARADSHGRWIHWGAD